MPQTPPVVLTIAGFDPSSGAGATADIKTIAAHGCFGVAALTALTVQSTAGVKRSEAMDVALLRETLEELKDDCKIAAVHIGMLGRAGVANAVADFLESSRLPCIVLDTIIEASSGARLLDEAGQALDSSDAATKLTAIRQTLNAVKFLNGLLRDLNED